MDFSPFQNCQKSLKSAKIAIKGQNRIPYFIKNYYYYFQVEVLKVTEVSKVAVPKVTEANKAVPLKVATEVNLVAVTEATKEATRSTEVTKRPYLPLRQRSTK